MKSASRPGDEPLTNGGSTAGQPRVNRGSTAGQPRVNRGSTAGQPLVNRWFCSSAGLHRNYFVRARTGMCRGIPSMQRRRCTSLHPVRIQERKAPLVLLVPGHALHVHGKGLQGQMGVVTLVSSQERRALAGPRMNQPRILFPRRFLCTN